MAVVPYLKSRKSFTVSLTAFVYDSLCETLAEVKGFVDNAY